MQKTIQSTEDYSIFQLMTGNREVDPNHVKRIKREIMRNPQLLESNPILVNENMFIIDGQHRYEACKELGKPIHYLVAEGASIEATRHLNTSQKSWSLLDFAKSYADSGREDYVTFIRMHKQFPKVNLSTLRTVLAGGRVHDTTLEFRRGEFTVQNLEIAKEYLDRLSTVISKTNQQLTQSMVSAFLQLFDNDEFDWSIFLQKLDRDSARELYRTSTAVRACLRSIEDVYNFQSKYQTRLY